MIIELGQLALLFALGAAIVLSIVPLVGAIKGWQRWMALARPMAIVEFVFVTISFLALTYAFVANDFTVTYVASNSNSALPWYYRVSAVWGGHEGSLLLWILMLGGWTAAVAVFSKALPLDSVARVLAIMGMVAVGFLGFIEFTSNPFERLLPIYPVDGRDLNPLLQDIGMIFHPPALYMGYVGFSVAFAFALSGLMVGRFDSAWARWSRPWTQAAWISLTIGIALGSWWAYYELGWGSWWFWDPVENASFMPWLAGTALLHSLAVSEKRGAFKIWTVLLALAAFSLSLLGTFLVRSGVLVSVHAFASDPSRGLFILAFLFIVVGGSLGLFAWRGPLIKGKGKFELISRETFLLANNLFLVTATLVVLVGTIWPLIHKELDWGSISVGPPFFNLLFTILTVPFAIMLGIGPLLRWRKHAANDLAKPLIICMLLAAVCTAVALLLQGAVHLYSIIGLFIAFWIALTSGYAMMSYRHNVSWLANLTQQSRSQWAMALGHIGFAITIVGITMVSNYSIEKDVRMQPGDSKVVNGYTFTFESLDRSKGPNYIANVGRFNVTYKGEPVAQLNAEKRHYQVQRNMMTEAAIDAGMTRDVFIALGEPLGDGAWAVRLHLKPFVRWIWLGAIVMSVGGIIAMLDRRYRVSKRPKRTGKSASTAAQANA